MIHRRRLLLGGTAIAAVATGSAPFAVHELAKWHPANLPVDQDVITWLKANAIPLATAEPGSGLHDLEFLRAVIGNARIVSLGEATHGTREFFLLKHRLIEFCVAELGFTVIAFEDNYGSTLAVNDYVIEGKGNAAEAVARGLDSRFWHTVEVIALVEWVRAWNIAHARKVKFYGFDMQWGTPAALRLFDYLRRVAPDLAATSEAPLARLLRNEWSARANAEQATILAQIKEILAAFDAERALWVSRSSELEWRLARLSAVAADQYVRLSWEPYHQGFTWRDRCMAANVLALLEAEGPHAKTLLWAHNAHVRRTPYRPGMLTMGGFLNAELGAEHVVIGFSFNQGGFRAVGRTPGRIENHVVSPAPAGFVDAALARTGLPLFALDLRRVPSRGPVATWMASKPLQRSVTAVFRPETRWYHPLYWLELFYSLGHNEDADDPRDNYDLLLLVDSTTPTRPSARRCPLQPARFDAIVGELRTRAQPVKTVMAGAGFDDLAALEQIIGDARIVALGEATHGTTEFFRMKHRLFEYLVERKGFTVLAFEANWPVVELADRYVKTGEGSAAAALREIGSWFWQTQEVRDLLEWMRAYNTGRGDRNLLSFTGFDMEDGAATAKCVVDILTRLGAPEAGTIRRLYAGTNDMARFLGPADLRNAQREREKSKLQADVAEALKLIDARRETLLKSLTPADYRRVRQCAAVVVQASFPGAASEGDIRNARDHAMAQNVRWLVDEEFPNEKIVLWAHNAHVATAPHMSLLSTTMGQHLRQTFGDQMRVAGFAFDRGGFRSIPLSHDKVAPHVPITITVPAAEPVGRRRFCARRACPSSFSTCAPCPLPARSARGSPNRKSCER